MNALTVCNAPPTWKRSKVGHHFWERSQKVSDEEFAPLSVTYDGVVPQLAHVAKTEDRENRKRVCIGDIVINSRSDRRGASGLSNLDGSVSLINLVLCPRAQPNMFFHYLFRNRVFQEEFYRRGHGIVDDLWTTRYSELRQIEIALPDADEQSRIVRFLDEFMQRLHQLTEAKNNQLGLMREREHALSIGHGTTSRTRQPTSIPWLPVMPMGWTTLRAKNLFRQLSLPPADHDKIITAFRDGEVTLRENRRETGYTFAVKEVGYQHIRSGDLVIHTMDAFAGAIGVSDSDGKATGEYAVCEPLSPDTNNHYFAQVLRYMADVGYIYVLCPSVRERAPRFRFSKLAPVLLPVPPKPEQDRIAEHVAASRAARRLIRKSIDALDEYASALITEIITGRRKVPEASASLSAQLSMVEKATRA